MKLSRSASILKKTSNSTQSSVNTTTTTSQPDSSLPTIKETESTLLKQEGSLFAFSFSRTFEARLDSPQVQLEGLNEAEEPLSVNDGERVETIIPAVAKPSALTADAKQSKAQAASNSRKNKSQTKASKKTKKSTTTASASASKKTELVKSMLERRAKIVERVRSYSFYNL
jgi:hypothetical protein